MSVPRPCDPVSEPVAYGAATCDEGATFDATEITLSTGTSSQATSSNSIWRLSTKLPADMLQGVGLDYVLQGFGREIAKQFPSQIQQRKIKRYDTFISHDWETHRCLKVLSCIVHFNSLPAAIGACLMALMCGTVRALQRRDCSFTTIGGEILCLHRSQFAYPLSMAVFFGLFCWWQRIKTHLLFSRTIVFFDKFCISQTDHEQKLLAIAGLAGFLRESESMMILWSPRYFSRLWCVYELASWLELKGQKQPVAMPVLLSVFLALALVLWSIQMLIVEVSIALDTSFETLFYMLFALAAVFFPFAFAVPYMLAADLAKLPSQVESFSVLEAKCTCCSMMHVDPVTNTAIPCDKEMVLNALRRWYAVDQALGLEAFDAHFKASLGPEFLKTIQGSPRLYWLVICTVSPVVLCWYITRYASVALHGFGPSLRVTMESVALAFCVVPISCGVCLKMATIGEHLTRRLPWRANVVIRGIPAFMVIVVLWAPLVPSRLMLSVAPQAFHLAALCVLTQCFFFPRGWNFAWQSVNMMRLRADSVATVG